MSELTDYAAVFKALSDETRLKILQLLSGKELCGCTLLSEFQITQPTLSYHMKLLCGCGLVLSHKEGSWMRYSLNKEKLEEILTLLSQIKKGKKVKIKEDCTEVL